MCKIIRIMIVAQCIPNFQPICALDTCTSVYSVMQGKHIIYSHICIYMIGVIFCTGIRSTNELKVQYILCKCHTVNCFGHLFYTLDYFKPFFPKLSIFSGDKENYIIREAEIGCKASVVRRSYLHPVKMLPEDLTTWQEWMFFLSPKNTEYLSTYP